MALNFRIGATKKKAPVSQATLVKVDSKSGRTKSITKKAATKKAATKKVTPTTKKPKAPITQKNLFRGGMASEAGRVLATKTAGYRSSGSNAKAPTSEQRKAGKILAVCKHYGRKKCNDPSSVVSILSKSKSTWKPVGAPTKRFTARKK